MLKTRFSSLVLAVLTALAFPLAAVAQTQNPNIFGPSGTTGTPIPVPTEVAGQTGAQTPGIPSIRNTPTPLQGIQEPKATRRVVQGPLPKSEFQRFVESSTGRSLDVFGAQFFQDTQDAFTPVERTPVPADYVIGPGDELQIRAWGMVDIDYRAVVDRNGQINLPKIGTIGVARLKASEIEDHLRAQIGKVFKSFSLNVTLGQLRTIQIFVVGQAARPGAYTVSGLSTLINAVFQSGGPGPNGSLRKVQLKRGNTVVTELDLYDFIIRGDKSKDARLLPGDVIVYHPVGAQVALLGALENPAIYEIAPTADSLSDVLTSAGGIRATTQRVNAHLERLNPSNLAGPRLVQDLKIAQASSTRLQDGDVITLFEVGGQFTNAITLRGSVAKPLRYPHAPGMRISELIPDREALITPDYYQRKNKLVQFVEDTRLKVTIGKADTAKVENDVKNIVDEPNWEYATIERLNADRITLSLSAFNLAKAVLEKDPQHNLLLQPGDVVTIFSSKDIKGPQARGTRLVRIEGEVDRPGVYQLLPGDTLRSMLARAGGLTAQAYLFGTEFSRESTRNKQRAALQDAVRRLELTLSSAGAKLAANLNTADAAAAAKLQEADSAARTAQLSRLRTLEPNGRIALELDAAIQRLDDLPDLPLEDGDRITVPSRPGFVFAVGAVANENGLIWRAGRTVKDYLRVAGVTQEADESNIFVVRADGSVVHAKDGGNFFGTFGGVNSLVLAPGDTVVVPDLHNRETPWTTFVRGAKDWTQILSNFGLAAAAIKTLRQ